MVIIHLTPDPSPYKGEGKPRLKSWQGEVDLIVSKLQKTENPPKQASAGGLIVYFFNFV
jgi:hypothetical protein